MHTAFFIYTYIYIYIKQLLFYSSGNLLPTWGKSCHLDLQGRGDLQCCLAATSPLIALRAQMSHWVQPTYRARHFSHRNTQEIVWEDWAVSEVISEADEKIWNQIPPQTSCCFQVTIQAGNAAVLNPSKVSYC